MGNGIYIPKEKFKSNQNRRDKFNNPDWPQATRDLSTFLYGNKLNTHNFTGNPSNSSKNKSKEIQGVLDQNILLGIQGENFKNVLNHTLYHDLSEFMAKAKKLQDHVDIV